MSKPQYEIKPLTKTDYLKQLTREIVDGVGAQDFTPTHIIKFVSDEIDKRKEISRPSTTLLYRVVGKELESMYDEQLLERYEGGPPWVYVNAEVVHGG